MSHRNIVLSITLSTFLAGTIALVASAAPKGDSQAGTAAERSMPVVAGELETRQLLLLLDADKNGRVSKQEFMRFMEAEFDRLDKDKSGELDLRELRESQLQVARPFSLGGK